MQTEIVVDEQVVSVDILAKEYGLTPEKVLELHKKGDIRVFTSAEECYDYICLEDAGEDDLREKLMEAISITAEDLKFFRTFAEKELYYQDVLFLNDGRYVDIYGHSVVERKPLIPIQLIDRLSDIFATRSDYMDVILTCDEWTVLEKTLATEMADSPFPDDEDLEGVINVYLDEIGFDYDMEKGYYRPFTDFNNAPSENEHNDQPA